MRASNADREKIAEVLRQAAGDGRLELDELDDRLVKVYAARTYAELEPLTSDLPHVTGLQTPAPVRTPVVRPAGDPGPRSSTGIAIMSGIERKGRWTVPGIFNLFAFWGGIQIDLREAYFTSEVVKIRAVAVMGGMEIVVPEDADVQVNGIGIMGGFDHGATGIGSAAGPRIEINGFAFWGGVAIKREPSIEEARRRRLERKQRRAERKALGD
jgi:hypothetical protein